MAQVIPFVSPNANHVMVCPDCRKGAWSLHVTDLDEDSGVMTAACRTRGCGFSISMISTWGVPRPDDEDTPDEVH